MRGVDEKAKEEGRNIFEHRRNRSSTNKSVRSILIRLNALSDSIFFLTATTFFGDVCVK